MSGGLKLALAAVAVIAVLGVIFYVNNANKGSGGQYAYQVGQPGPGNVAPPIQLAATTGGSFDLASLRGQTVLLYFQEGVTCEPCWTQLKDIQNKRAAFRALGIDQIVSITTDPLNVVRQKVADEGISIPVLSDPDLRVSQAYQANQYGMMGTSRDGHSFILIGKDGTITWRADYGGAPNYTMYVPVDRLVTDIKQGIAKGIQ